MAEDKIVEMTFPDGTKVKGSVEEIVKLLTGLRDIMDMKIPGQREDSDISKKMK
jgi:hypothetical protein